MKLKKIGYISWLKGELRPDLDETDVVHCTPLTDGDRKAGYIEQAVFIDEDEQPA
jgi:hypothetical protein